MTATLDPATAVGSVQFTDGSSALGDPVTVANGTTSTTTTLPAGKDLLTRGVQPTDSTAVSAPISNTLAYTVNGDRGDRHGTRGILGRNRGNRGVLGGHRGHRTTVNNNPTSFGTPGILGNLR